TSQASSLAGTRDWKKRLTPLFGQHLRLEELTVNYRTPQHIMDPATRAGRAAGLHITDPVTARIGDHPVEYIRLSEPDGQSASASELGVDLARKVADIAHEQSEELGSGQLAIITPGTLLPTIQSAMSNGTQLPGQLSVLTPEESKGLEFDIVILVEPGPIAAVAGRGPGDLYVAMSRPTQKLIIVHRQPLPAGLP
ncbi:MAG TPA: hypothetical protein VK030_04060, partial [Actinomycetales bacterium]|nr:hypothetical protein [Actinomycetales bacterium]